MHQWRSGSARRSRLLRSTQRPVAQNFGPTVGPLTRLRALLAGAREARQRGRSENDDDGRDHGPSEKRLLMTAGDRHERQRTTTRPTIPG